MKYSTSSCQAFPGQKFDGTRALWHDKLTFMLIDMKYLYEQVPNVGDNFSFNLYLEKKIMYIPALNFQIGPSRVIFQGREWCLVTGA